MSEHIKVFIIFIFAVLMFCGCGRQYKAEAVVKDFLDNNLQADAYTVSFQEIDSTKNVTDSVVDVMRFEAGKNKMFRKGIAYAPINRQYIYVQAKVCVGNDTINHTFYINPELTRIVSFKVN